MKKYLNLVLIIVLMISCGRDEGLMEAENFYAAGEYEQAIEKYSEHLSMHPANIMALYNRGRAYEETGQIEKALADFNAVIKREPSHGAANMSLAKHYYFRTKDYAKSVTYTNNIMESNDTHSGAYTLRGKTYQKMGELEKARNDYDKAISIDVENTEAYVARGSLMLHIRDKERACNDFLIAKNLGDEGAGEAYTKYCK